MPKVLTTASHVDCLHGGHATLSSTASLPNIVMGASS